MATRASAPTALVWLTPEQGELLEGVLATAGVRAVQVGAPDGAHVEGFEQAERISDLRHAIASSDADLLLCAASADAAPLDDPELVAQCRGRGMLLLSFEPMPAAVVDLRDFERREGVEPIRVLPLLRHARSLADAKELLEHLGPLRTVTVAVAAPTTVGSLGARLYDALAFVHALIGVPDRIEAAIAGAGPFRAAPVLRGLRGDCTAHLRYERQRSAIVAASTVGGWRREAIVAGDDGLLVIGDAGVEHRSARGELLDRTEMPHVDPDDAVAIIADRLRHAIDPHAPATAPVDRAGVLAMCEAALLSAHTGHPEHPTTLLRMGGAG